MHCIVYQNVLEISKATLPDCSKTTHVHQRGTITVDAENFLLRLCKSNTKRYRRAVTHAADSEKIMAMGLAFLYTQLKHFP
mmetsp:Transcript_47500/g.88901  ORF Transcript_47500/g.88901 Transcript_47500/m.88901 type:complete len:81 (-) Transcript_47500:188-430(-)